MWPQVSPYMYTGPSQIQARQIRSSGGGLGELQEPGQLSWWVHILAKSREELRESKSGRGLGSIMKEYFSRSEYRLYI